MAATRAQFWLMVCGAALVLAALLAVRALSGAGPLIADSDDAMRLVQVRDLVAGQGLQDLVQHRLNAPFGASMHWSRLLDLPLALGLVALQPFVGPDLAVQVLAFVWPLVLIVPLMALSGALAMALGGREALLGGLVLVALAVPVLFEFAPGRVDHHAIQMLLTLGLALASVRALDGQRIGAPVLAGLVAATALAVGTESLPVVAASVLAFGLMWVSEARRGGQMAAFGLSFGLASAAHLALAQPVEHWFAPVCDMLGAPYVAAALGVALVFALLAILPVRGWTVRGRLLLGAALGALLLGGLLAAYPQCLGGPYAALDPFLKTHWIGSIVEARPVWESMVALPVYTLGALVPPVLGLLVSLWLARRGPAERRGAFAVLALFLLLSVLVMVVQVRGARLAAVLAVPVGSALIAQLRGHYLGSGSRGALVGLVLGWVGFSGVIAGFAGGALVPPQPGNPAMAGIAGQAGQAACSMPAAFSALAARPRANVMAPVDLGAHLLLYTPHAVVGAPYHRNGAGIGDTLRFFDALPEAGRAMLAARQISLVVVCPGLPEMAGYPDTPEGALSRLLARGTQPDWLVPIDLGASPLMAYAVAEADRAGSGQVTPVPLRPQ